ncbi:aminodeoxychorismate lyase [Thalassotalea maritima]|uniref:aminodeoxychorismate lyase n=1 Tax=Thalassotalea maritima TaxID=3242416 RepID=UPI0035293897
MTYTSVNFSQQHTLNVKDRGLAFGDGVFTTARVVRGKVEYVEQHIQRLVDACQRLALDNVPFATVRDEINKAAVDINDGCLKVIITAGESNRGYARANPIEPTVIVQTSAYPVHYHRWQNEGICLAVSQLQLGINPMLAGIKHLNRLEQVLMRNELDGLAADELVVSDVNGHVVECSSANIFWQQHGQWFTPDLSLAGVNGIIRQQLVKKLNAKIVTTDVNALFNADSIFICNAILGIAPVVRLANKTLDIDAKFICGLQQSIKE